MGKKDLEKQSQDLQRDVEKKRAELQQKETAIAKAKASKQDAELRQSLLSELAQFNSGHSKDMADLEDEFRQRSRDLSSMVRHVRFQEEADVEAHYSGTAPSASSSSMPALAEEYLVSGAEAVCPDAMGLFTRSAIPPIGSHGGRPIYTNGRGYHLFFWASSTRWLIDGPGTYEDGRGIIQSESSHERPELCSGWKVWDASTWSSHYPISVANPKAGELRGILTRPVGNDQGPVSTPTRDDAWNPDRSLEASPAFSSKSGEPAMVPERDALEAEAESGVGWRELHDREEQRALLARGELQRVQAEMRELKLATGSEQEAAAAARQELIERQKVADRFHEEKMSELQETERQSEALKQAQDALERECKALQRQLSQAMYDVGKKDREQQLKETELHEVRQSIQSIQDEMDQVNRQLQAQCGRVQRVESSLRLSRDLGSKVLTMREMLKESHSALGQLCALVEHERAQRGECSQGLRQQQMRTELLLQLLSHFKNRTQDLAPQVLLSQAAELVQGHQMGSQASHPPTSTFPSEPVAGASHLSAVPPLTPYGAAGYHPA